MHDSEQGLDFQRNADDHEQEQISFNFQHCELDTQLWNAYWQHNAKVVLNTANKYI